MIILRSKSFSEDDKSKGERLGESLGTATVGTLGTLGLAHGGEKIAKSRANIAETKKMKAEFSKGVEELMKERRAQDFAAKTKRAHAQGRNSSSIIDMLMQGRNNKKADKEMVDAINRNRGAYKKGVDNLKFMLNEKRLKRINSIGKKTRLGILAAGGLTTLGASGNKLIKKEE